MKKWTYPYSPTQLQAAWELKNMSFDEAAEEAGISRTALYLTVTGKTKPHKYVYQKVVSFLRPELAEVSTTGVSTT